MRTLFALWVALVAGLATAQPIVIAHRGASAYLPEHTLAAKAVAHAMGADFIEQDVVLTADNVPIVLHDIHLETTTDVAQKFPGRARDDNRYYARDFTLAEIRQLQVHERSTHGGGDDERAVYPQRFPLLRATGMAVPTLAEEIDLIVGLDTSRNRRTGLYIELKAPQWHRDEGADIALEVMQVLRDKQLADQPDRVYLQCFDDRTLRYLHNELKVELPLIQLLGENSWGEDGGVDYDFLRSPAGLEQIASYAAGIGPWVEQIYLGKDAQGKAQFSDLVQRAHNHKLLVHPYTLRRDQLPAGVTDFDELMQLLFEQARVDGAFTDFPDLLRNYLDASALSQ
jgi:glycerophosphoryl diester phosphodiesterase